MLWVQMETQQAKIPTDLQTQVVAAASDLVVWQVVK